MMKFLFWFLGLLLFSCQNENDNLNGKLTYSELLKTDTAQLKNNIYWDSIERAELLILWTKQDSGYIIDDWFHIDTAKRKLIWDTEVPKALVNVKDLEPLQSDTNDMCDFYHFVQLSNKWQYFAYETKETNHYNNIYIYRKDGIEYEIIDTLFGIVVDAYDSNKEVYDLTLLEAYWGDSRPRNMEYYEFNGEKFDLVKEKKGEWRKDQN